MNYEAEGKVTVGGSAQVTNSAYTYVASGGLSIKGCSVTRSSFYIHANFKEGDPAYEARLARKGRLDRLVIKKIIVINNARTGGLYHINYVDTLNTVYLERELVDHEAAIELATAYYELKQAQAIAALENSCG